VGVTNVRQRRLKADYDLMCSLFPSGRRIRILKTLGNPPEKYQVELLVTSLQKHPAAQTLQTHNAFIAEIVLTAGYPRMAPQCRMLTPVFHPNIAPHAICIGDHWTAGESLPHLVVRIAEMLAYQSYNVKSPLDGEAARWVEMNKDKLPLDTYDFASLLGVGEVVGRSADGTLKAGDVCANCGRRGGDKPLHVCINLHAACDACVLECPVCRKTLCLKCPRETCVICRRAACAKCTYKCGSCGQVACLEHTGTCHVCGRRYCANCLVQCDVCGKTACVGDIAKIEREGRKLYACTACAAL
jgi:ubiquitin-protein ligase